MLNPEPIVRVENVGMRYGRGPEILRDVTFSLEPGSFYFLVGPSGAGKSSLLKLLYLALRPTRGLVTMFGHDIATMSKAHLPELRRRIGVVFQDFRLLDHLTAIENVTLPLRVSGVKGDAARENVTELLRWVGLEKHRRPIPGSCGCSPAARPRRAPPPRSPRRRRAGRTGRRFRSRRCSPAPRKAPAPAPSVPPPSPPACRGRGSGNRW